MQRIQEFWLQQTIAEYNSSAQTIHLVHWMQQLAMSPDLIRQAIRVADDEIVHAQMCYTVAIDAGIDAPLPEEHFSLSFDNTYEDLRCSFLAALVENYCMAETVAVPLFSAMRQQTKQRSALALYNQVLKDEPLHASFGWLTLAWCDEIWPETRQWLTFLVPQALQAIKKAYCSDDSFQPPLSANEYQWGMMDKQEYSRILFNTVKNIYAERFKHYDISLSQAITAWE